MAGAASHGIKSGAASAEGRVRGKPSKSSPRQAPSCIRAQIPPPTGVGEKTCATHVGLGEEGWKPAGGAGGGGSDPRAGCCLMERSARSSSRREATTRGPSRALKRPVCLTGRQPLLALRQRQATLRSGPRASLRQGPQTSQAAPRDQLAGAPAHPPRTAATSSVPPSPVGTRAAALPVPWLRPARPGPRTAAEPGPSTRRRPTEPDAAQPSSCPCRRGPPAHLRRHSPA